MKALYLFALALPAQAIIEGDLPEVEDLFGTAAEGSPREILIEHVRELVRQAIEGSSDDSDDSDDDTESDSDIEELREQFTRVSQIFEEDQSQLNIITNDELNNLIEEFRNNIHEPIWDYVFERFDQALVDPVLDELKETNIDPIELPGHPFEERVLRLGQEVQDDLEVYWAEQGTTPRYQHEFFLGSRGPARDVNAFNIGRYNTMLLTLARSKDSALKAIWYHEVWHGEEAHIVESIAFDRIREYYEAKGITGEEFEDVWFAHARRMSRGREAACDTFATERLCATTGDATGMAETFLGIAALVGVDWDVPTVTFGTHPGLGDRVRSVAANAERVGNCNGTIDPDAFNLDDYLEYDLP